jgi:tripartite-type tricarboxylate transporter receptor subunit TctC
VRGRKMKEALRALAALIFFVFGTSAALAQPYPSRPITIIVPVAPGGVSDTLARALAQRLSPALNQQVVIENRGGAAHTIGAAAVAKAAPDGHTLLLTEGTALIPGLYKSLPYDPEKDLAPVSGLITISQGVVVNPALPVNDVRALVALASRSRRG